jgi:predicted metal-dependent peptidase
MPKEEINTGVKAADAIVPTVTPEEAAAFDIDDHLVKLLLEEPFYGRITRCLTKVESTDLPTAGVTSKDGNLTLYWNREFCAGLLKEGANKMKGLLKHESMHLIFEHCTTRRLDPHTVANIAADCAINSMIPDDELPNCGIWPGKPALIASPDPINQLIGGFPKGKSQEWYFTKLMDNKDVQKALEEGGEGMPGAMDDHDGWDAMSEEEKEIAKGKIKAALEAAVKACDKTGQWGSVPGEMRSTLRAMVSKQVDWRKVLRNWVGMTRRANRTTTWQRINKRCPGLLSGARRGYTCSIASYIDQSGSVSDREQELLFGELNSLASRREIDLLPFDTAVDETGKVTMKRGRKVVPFRTRCGGTDFSAPMDHFKKNRKKYDGIIILTDGEAADPGPPLRGTKRLWVITPGCKLLFTPHPGDQVVNMVWPKGDA